MTLKFLPTLCALLAVLFLAACGGTPAPVAPAKPDEVAALSRAIRALGPDVDPAEADRAARIAFDYSRQLSFEYGITDPPLIHNIKVNQGLRPRGLCWHWAQDMQTRLRAEGFKTLALHRAIANSTNILIEHSTAIISAKGADFTQGVVLDPWRFGGVLFWSPTLKDPKYHWLSQAEVHAAKRRRLNREAGAY